MSPAREKHTSSFFSSFVSEIRKKETGREKVNLKRLSYYLLYLLVRPGVFFFLVFLLCRPLSPDLDRAGRDADGNV